MRRRDEGTIGREVDFRAAFAQAPTAIGLADLDRRLVHVNGELCRLLGRSERQLVGVDFLEVTHPEDRDANIERIRRLIRGETPAFRLQKRYLRHDGSTVWAEAAVTLLHDEQGRARHIISHVHELTERPRVERQRERLLGEQAEAERRWRIHEQSARRQAEAQAAHEHEIAAQEHRIAATLQRSLLPEPLPQVPGVALAARYEAGARGTEVGGDWYDALPLPDGSLAIVIGDVMGRGLGATSLLGQVRNALRGYLMLGGGPGLALARLGQLVGQVARRALATAAVAVIAPGGRTTLASAGHPPPLLITLDGSAEFVPLTPGPPLAGIQDARYPESHVSLAHGATLLLYTDGLVELRGEGIDRLERLRGAGAAGCEDPERLVEHVLDTMTAAHDRPDDMALIAATARTEPAGGEWTRGPQTYGSPESDE